MERIQRGELAPVPRRKVNAVIDTVDEIYEASEGAISFAAGLNPLPTEEPETAGQLWNSGGVVRVAGTAGRLDAVYASRDELLSPTARLSSLADGDIVMAGGLFYERQAGATAIPDLPDFIPGASGVSPAHFGAVPGTGQDCSTQVQAAADFIRSSYNTAKGRYDYDWDWFGETFRADDSIDLTMARNPGLTLRNGRLYSKAAGKIALDLAGSNTVTLIDFQVRGDATTPPRCGIYVGRCLIGGGYPASANFKMTGTSGFSGGVEWLGYCNMASEVESIEGSVQITVRSRSLLATPAAHVSDMQTIVDQFGSALESDFVDLPPPGTDLSNLGHNLSQLNLRHQATINTVVEDITNANPAVVTVASVAGLSNGDTIFISGGNIGMTGVAGRVYTIGALDAVANTFTLVGKDTTAAGAYTSGASVQNQTGPGWLTSGLRSVNAEAAYIVTYGGSTAIIDGDGGSPPREWQFAFQTERDAPVVLEIRKTSGTMTCPEMYFYNPMHEQVAHDAVVKLVGAGTVVFNGGCMRISNMSEAPTNGLFSPWSSFTFRGYDIAVPLEAALTNGGGLPATYTGTTFAADRLVKLKHHGSYLEDFEGATFGTNGTVLTEPGIRYSLGKHIVYRPGVAAEREIQVRDSAITGAFTSAANAINTEDKYPGKMAWNTTLNRPVWATGSTSTSVWNFADGTLAHTPA